MEKVKPILDVSNQDGNIFAVVGAASKELRRTGLKQEIEEMRNRVNKSKSYDEALSIISEYVEFSFGSDEDDKTENCENCGTEYNFEEGCGNFCSNDCEFEYYEKG